MTTAAAVIPDTAQALPLAPILAASHRQIRELGSRRSTSLSHVQRTVERDPAVALNLFTAVNAHLKRAGRPPVGDIQRAILFMGMAEFPGRLTEAAILEDVVDAKLAKGLTRILCRAHHASRQAHAIGRMTGGLNPDELLAAAITRGSLSYVERIAASNAVRLNTSAFNDFLPAAPADHDARIRADACLDFAARFASVTETEWDDAKLDPLVTEIAQFTGRAPGDVASGLRAATLDAARTGTAFAAYPAALHLMSPGSVPAEARACGDAAPVDPVPARKAAAKRVQPAKKRTPRPAAPLQNGSRSPPPKPRNLRHRTHRAPSRPSSAPCATANRRRAYCRSRSRRSARTRASRSPSC